MPRTSVLIVGGGQAGLSMSHCLTDLRIDHVILERGSIAERWRTHGWESLRLLTPNWMSRLPGFHYQGDDPDGFMTAGDLVTRLDTYAAGARARILTATGVVSLERSQDHYCVATTGDTWRADAVVIATGYCDLPAVPALARNLPDHVEQLVPADYRRPGQLSRERVLIVGASATGVQLAEEIHASGRPVILAAGTHTRLPRRYRGKDILWWLDRMGVLTEAARSVYNLDVSRAQPSLQLAGRLDRATLDLARLHAQGVQLAGRLVEATRRTVRFADDLIATTAAADVKLAAIRLRIDDYIRGAGLAAPAPDAFEPTWPIAAHALTALDLRADRIGTIIWATGYRRAYPWLRVPVLDARGEISHESGVTASPGLYVLGMNFQRRRNSSFIDGVGDDARYLAAHLAATRLRQRIA